MSWWLTTADVADELGIADDPDDTRLARACASASSWVEGLRWDLFGSGINPYAPATGAALAPPPAHIHGAAASYAALLYQSAAAPEGFDGYAELGPPDDDTGARLALIRQQLGSRRPVIA